MTAENPVATEDQVRRFQGYRQRVMIDSGQVVPAECWQAFLAGATHEREECAAFCRGVAGGHDGVRRQMALFLADHLERRGKP